MSDLNLFTKIIATIGPSSDTKEMIEKLYHNGMRVARLNFSHGDYSYFDKVIKNIRSVSNEIAILLDTKGPEIRTLANENDEEIEYVQNQKVKLYNKTDKENTKDSIYISYKDLLTLDEKNLILIDDGLLEIKILKNEKDHLEGKILNTVKLGSKKTITIRNHKSKFDFISKKDLSDIEYGIKNEFDFIALSFVRSKKDILEVEKIIEKNKSCIRIISKIENVEAINNIEEICVESFGVMIARGDLGVEIDSYKLPELQKKIIKTCNELGKPVIVATQMLESMKVNPRPTRAEVSDVANAIIDGCDAIMLSGETANGKYPDKSVLMMNKIAKKYEKNLTPKILENQHLKQNEIALAITKVNYYITKELHTQGCVVITQSGYSARMVSRFKLEVPILTFVKNLKILRKTQLSFGVMPFILKNLDKIETEVKLIEVIGKFLKEDLNFKDEHLVTFLHGLINRKNSKREINTLKLHKIKDILAL